MMPGRIDRLVGAIERLICAKTTEIWMNIIIGTGLVLLTIWGVQAIYTALHQFAKMNGVM